MEACAADTAALLSLAGVGVVALNQWGTSFTANDLLLRGTGRVDGGDNALRWPMGRWWQCALMSLMFGLCLAGIAAKAKPSSIAEAVRVVYWSTTCLWISAGRHVSSVCVCACVLPLRTAGPWGVRV